MPATYEHLMVPVSIEAIKSCSTGQVIPLSRRDKQFRLPLYRLLFCRRKEEFQGNIRCGF
jgi:hypothetical protein